MSYSPYHWCSVPECKNSSIKTPEKLWIRVPTDLDMRRKWLKLASRDPKKLLISKSHVHFCEDHFDLENDMENYKQYKALGSVKRIYMKPNIVPTRFDCQTKVPGVPPPTTSELKEPQFGVSKPNSRSVVSVEQSTMSNLLSPMKTEVLNENITEMAPIPILFCICCLEREVPFISLLTCSHADFLNNFMMPEIKPRNQIICYQCHEKLKTIKLFKLQVEESFKLLSTSTENTTKSSNQRHNLKIRQVFNIDIPHTNFSNIENPQIKLEDASTDDIIKEEKEFFVEIEQSLPPPNSLQTKNMKNIEEAIRIIHNNQHSDCINFLANSLQSVSHSLISDICTNFELGSQNDTNPTETIINIPTANSTETVTNNLLNKNLNTVENSEIINKETIKKENSEDVDVVENVATEELNQPVTKMEFIDVGESNNMQTDESMVTDKLSTFRSVRPLRPSPSLGSNIKQLTLTREELMQEREKIAISLSYLRAPHRCESCLIGFQFQENFEDHFKRKHTSGKRQTIQCDVCLQYVDSGAKNMHMFWHYTRFECVACAEKFTSYDKAAIHYRKNHPNVKSTALFQCPHCPYNTGRRKYFRDHLNAYTKCELCGVMLGCATGIKLKVHMRNCLGKTPKTAKLKTIKSEEN